MKFITIGINKWVAIEHIVYVWKDINEVRIRTSDSNVYLVEDEYVQAFFEYLAAWTHK